MPGISRPVDRVRAPTERRNPRTEALDRVGTRELLELLAVEDALVPAAVAEALPELVTAVDLAVAALAAGGRVHYFGAGTSGRLAVLDAAEVVPTFGLAPGVFVAHHAGGPAALTTAVEDVEDDEQQGADDASGVRPGDLAVGITASGRTPYVGGALRAAGRAGAVTVLVSANPQAPLASLARVHICTNTGPEALTGSTRLKAATAAKLVLSSFSTAALVRSGRTYSNLMVEVTATNAKLRGRSLTILEELSSATETECVEVLHACAGDLKLAIVCLLADLPPDRARAALLAGGGRVRAALDTVADRHPR